MNYGSVKQVCYFIKGANSDEIKKNIFESIGFNVLKIEIVPDSEKVILTYYEHLITPTYIDYRFHLKGLDFRREGG